MNFLAVKSYLFILVVLILAIFIASDDADDTALAAEDAPAVEDPSATNLPSTVAASAANHTLCYDYFLQKDGCVQSSVDMPCTGDPNAPITADYAGIMGDVPENQRFRRRYDTTNGSVSIHGGGGICGPYDPSTVSGVCLWSGTSWVNGADPQTAGWLNWAGNGNCGKQIFIQRQNQPETVQVAKVLDGCNFYTTDPAVGCFQIWMTKSLFDKFNPTAEEDRSLLIASPFTWNFDNLDGQTPENAPL
ncbi:uncharacterized protein MELLADRAFT_105488 [Melampsora larici-populina 98AG31]|uniref:Secreted protein n=1 Tax=Melampsora larici-populina (strain 98AG31 / pathotype 3-4-7) TaxID=747676 RepID=F4RIB1_MELLP|nr:uncharacterized protein MELLADRAFT_105488 [Melampsora larici-populina 98AG31]EGG07975.1 secreted protein [Melampsora larici-populina 98AG31]